MSDSLGRSPDVLTPLVETADGQSNFQLKSAWVIAHGKLKQLNIDLEQLLDPYLPLLATNQENGSTNST